MLSLRLDPKKEGSLTFLCLGAHSDDIEIGCGGTILQWTEAHPQALFYWVVLSANDRRKKEARKSAHAFLAKAKQKRIVLEAFKDGFFPYMGKDIKGFFERLKRRINADCIFTHNRYDLHQDHRLIGELTWNTFRDHLILEYEIPKYDGDMGSPNVFVPLKRSTCTTKLDYIVKHFQSQRDRKWFTRETFEALMRLRGMEANAPDKCAEAFYCRKAVL